jgi:uncharacterized protein (DUF2147 family)
MQRILIRAVTLTALAALPFAASARGLEGQWRNPKGSIVVKVTTCGGGHAYCATVVDASDKAKASARRGGTPRLIGTQILSDLKPTGNGTYKGRAFEPKRNIRAPATVRVVGPDTITVKGCLISGIICKQQRWTRVG